jgi:hypothetical protein
MKGDVKCALLPCRALDIESPRLGLGRAVFRALGALVVEPMSSGLWLHCLSVE